MVYSIMAGFDGKQERVALICESEAEAISRLNKAFKKITDNLWIDSFNQEFSIVEGEPYDNRSTKTSAEAL